MKHLIFDAGPLINFAMNGSLHIIRRLKKEFKGDFLITKEVKQEIIDRPLNIPRFELEALQIKALFDEGIIKHADLTQSDIEQLRQKRERLMQIANNTFKTKKGYVHLIDKGESAALALALIMKQKAKKLPPIVVDERTTRILCENPENLRKLFEKKFHTSIKANTKNYAFFKDFQIIRSTELAYLAHKKQLFEIKDPRALGAMLYGLKIKGCSISQEEVEQMKKL